MLLKRKLIYQNEGRGGSVIYKDNISVIRFYFEFGGGDCVAIIFVPASDKWERDTKRTVAEKNEIVDFIAEQATRDQVSNGYFKISDDAIEIFKR